MFRAQFQQFPLLLGRLLYSPSKLLLGTLYIFAVFGDLVLLLLFF